MPALTTLLSPLLTPLLSTPLTTLLPALLLTTLLLYILYQHHLHPLSPIPGPPLASLTRLWLLLHSLRGDLHRLYPSLHHTHGPLIRTAPNELSIASPSAVKRIYGAGSRFRKSEWYSVWQGRRTFDLFAERDERVHAKQRSLVASAYSMTSLRELEGGVDDCVREFVAQMGRFATAASIDTVEGEGEVCDMGLWTQLFAFDVVGALSFSKTFGFMEAGADDGSFAAIQKALGSANWVGQVPWVFWLNEWVARQAWGTNLLALNSRHGRIRAMAAREVKERMERGGEGKGEDGKEMKDILGMLFKIQKTKPDLDDAAVASMATSNIFAGSDTTAISLRAVIYYLLKNPSTKRRLVEEIDARKKAVKLSDPVTLAEADSMPYLQAVMHEALRLHPAVGMTLPRVVPEGGVDFEGQFLPAGTVVGVCPWVIHRNKDIFGEDVEAFRPERWMGPNNGDMHRFSFAFGAGSRLCIGKNISWMEMSKLIPTLFLHYDLELAEPDSVWTEKCWWFVMQEGLSVRLTKRAA